MPQLKKLFEPITIGNVEIKNRIFMLGMTTGLGENFRVNDRLVNFFGARAKGGVGLVTVGSCYPSDFGNTKPQYKVVPLGVGIWSDEFIPGLQKITRVIHDNGSKASCQLMMCYEWRPNENAPLEVVAPSDGPSGPGIGQARALTVAEIKQVIEHYAEAVRRARDAGFDMVEFQGGIGYFIARFLSPYSNKRTDDYGGSLENRLRFLLEIIELSKKKAGNDFTLIARLSADEFLDGGNKLADTLKMVPYLEKAGLAAFNIQAGWHESPRPLVQQWVPDGAFVYLAEAVKKVASLPVVTAYRIADPFLAEKIVAEGKADLVGMARALVADAEFANKAKERRFKEIRHCIACCHCIENNLAGETVTCSVNPDVCNQPLKAAPESRKVLVIGGGPSGMEAALVASSRGHKVTLCEKGRRLGGLMMLGSVLNDKLIPFVDWNVRQIKNSAIDVRLGTEVTPAMLEELKPDVVIIAAGGEPVALQIPGVNGRNVISGYDIKNMMNGKAPKSGLMWSLGTVFARYLGGNPSLVRKLMGMNFPIKKRVAIIGGQFAGLEVALGLMEKGKQITVIEESKRLGTDVGPVSRWVELDILRKGGVKLETLTKPKEITDKGVQVIRDGTKEDFMPADTVMLALGLKNSAIDASELKKKVPNIYIIGDAAGGSGIRRIREAMASGYEVGNKV